MDRREVIIIIASEATCANLGWGFIDRLYDLYTNNEEWSVERFKMEVESSREYIKNNVEWMKSIKERAAKEGVSADSVVTRDALWQANMKFKEERESKEAEKNKPGNWTEEKIEAAIDNYRLKIKADKKWMKDIRERSTHDRISVDSLITSDAMLEVNKLIKENK